MEKRILPIQQDGNYLHSHSSYMEDWKDANGPIWKPLMKVTQEVATAMLKQAFVLQNEGSEPTNYSIGNKGIIVCQVDMAGVFALTNRDGNLYLIVGEFKRIEDYILRRLLSQKLSIFSLLQNHSLYPQEKNVVRISRALMDLRLT